MKQRNFAKLLIPLSILAGLSVLILTGVIGGAGDYQTVKVPTYSVKVPPKSLDRYYPPQSEEPLFLYAMFALEGPLGALITSVNDGNIEKAMEYFQAFKKEYTKVSKMVPEWSDYFPSNPPDGLGEALKSKNAETIRAAIQQLGGVCGRCHQENRVAVWYRYHWKDFEQVSVEDPVSGKTLSWMEYMFALSGSFSGTNTYLSERQFDKTQVALQGLQSRLQSLKKGCESCHNTEREYFISSDVRELLSEAAGELKQKEPDSGKVAGYLQKAGMESCYKCHLVHIPAATVHRAWTAESEGH